MTETDELMLADFLQTMMAHCPQLSEHAHEASIGKNSGLLHVDSITIADDSIVDKEHHISAEDLHDYHISMTEELSGSTVENIVALYTKGGKMNVRCVNHVADTLCRRLKRMPNTNRVTIGKNEKVTVVGDLHGQLDDILKVIDDAGMPSATNKYVFNGGFIDRGKQGVEVTVIVFAMMLAFPDSVFVNRGSHEDQGMASACGFDVEVTKKYDHGLFMIFCETFKYLPLFTIINDAIFVVHGGLFHDRNVTLESLDMINRMDYKSEAEDPNSERNKAFPQGYFLKRLQQDALWSDPTSHGNGVAANRNFDKLMAHPTSGMGVMFGPSHTSKFLQHNKLKMVLRSHQVVPNGFDLPYKDTPSANKIGTVFTTSNFLNSGNLAAFVVFHSHSVKGATKVDDCDLWYSVLSFNTTLGEETEEKKTERLLHELILKKWNALLIAFQTVDTENTGFISKVQWADIMREVTKIRIMWMQMVAVLVPARGLRNLGHEIDYNVFLDRFKPGAEDEMDMQGMYFQRKKLTAIFRYFDTDGNGTISKEEFRTGFAVLNESLPLGLQLSDPDGIMKLIDMDGDDGITMNEFFEVVYCAFVIFLMLLMRWFFYLQVFRLLDSADGKADGNIDLTKIQKQNSIA